MTHKILMLALVAALAACTAEQAPSSAATPAPAPVADQPAQNVPPATAPATADTPAPAVDTPSTDAPPADAANGGDELARFDGYGDMRFGIAETEMEKAWGGELKRLGTEADACYYMTPKWVKTPAEFAFMVDGGKFVRYSTESAKMVAPGGGKIGMSADEIAKLYGTRVESQPHKYVQGGKYLRVKDSAGAGVLVFETDAKGRVTEWRVGLPPQVDYVEGCS
jgi:hypothetical protein